MHNIINIFRTRDAGLIQWARGNCALKRSVAARPHVHKITIHRMAVCFEWRAAE